MTEFLLGLVVIVGILIYLKTRKNKSTKVDTYKGENPGNYDQYRAGDFYKRS
jgi:hypothetical protein